MGQILIRRLDDAVVAALKARAKANNRSAEAEARAILGAAVAPPPPERRKLSDFIGAAPTGRTMEDIVRDVRALRDAWPD
jgi:plasmid stability protein